MIQRFEMFRFLGLQLPPTLNELIQVGHSCLEISAAVSPLETEFIRFLAGFSLNQLRTE